MVRTRGVFHLELTVTDLDAAIAFYGNVFGFEVVRRGNVHALLQTPGTQGTLALEKVTSPERERRTHFGLALVDPDDLEPVLALTVAHGGRIISRVEHALGGASASIADPHGHRIAL